MRNFVFLSLLKLCIGIPLFFYNCLLKVDLSFPNWTVVPWNLAARSRAYSSSPGLTNGNQGSIGQRAFCRPSHDFFNARMGEAIHSTWSSQSNLKALFFHIMLGSLTPKFFRTYSCHFFYSRLFFYIKYYFSYCVFSFIFQSTNLKKPNKENAVLVGLK